MVFPLDYVKLDHKILSKAKQEVNYLIVTRIKT